MRYHAWLLHTEHILLDALIGGFPQEVQTLVSLHQVVCFLGTCVSEAGKRKDSGQQGQTRQPLRSHQVCRDTLEHSEPDGICPQGVRSRPDDIQTQGQAKKEGRIEDGTSCLQCTIYFNNIHAIIDGNPNNIVYQLYCNHIITDVHLHTITHTPIPYTLTTHVHACMHAMNM